MSTDSKLLAAIAARSDMLSRLSREATLADSQSIVEVLFEIDLLLHAAEALKAASPAAAAYVEAEVKRARNLVVIHSSSSTAVGVESDDEARTKLH